MYVIVAHDGSSSRDPLVTNLSGTATNDRPSVSTGILDVKGRPIFRVQRRIGFHIEGVN
jgi:hypothetical protein